MVADEAIAAMVAECLQKVLDSRKELPYSDDTRLIEDLGLDSLRFIEFLTNLEDEFNFAIPDTEFEIASFDSFGKVMQYVRRALAKVDLLTGSAARDVSRDD